MKLGDKVRTLVPVGGVLNTGATGTYVKFKDTITGRFKFQVRFDDGRMYWFGVGELEVLPDNIDFGGESFTSIPK